MELYKWLLLARLHDLFSLMFGIIFILFCLLCLFSAVSIFIDSDKEDKRIFCKFSLIGFLLVLLVGIFTCIFPSKSDVAIMFSYDAVQSDTVSEVVELLKEKYL